MIHPAIQMPFPELQAGIKEGVDAGLITEQSDGDLRIYCYSKQAVFERAWGPFVRMCRGLILDVKENRVVATPWPKFFNYGEMNETIPDLPFEVTDKLDGSLIIIFRHNGRWRTATKGSFSSDQAMLAADLLKQTGDPAFPPGTHLAELVGPSNRIVIEYTKDALVLLGGYDQYGVEIPFASVKANAFIANMKCVPLRTGRSITDIMDNAHTLPGTEEGWVLRFSNGHRLKIKGDEYCRLHRLIERVTPLGIWESMLAGDNMLKIRNELPEECWQDFDTIHGLLFEQKCDILIRIGNAASDVAKLTDKELGLSLNKLFDGDIRPFIFTYRKNGMEGLMTGTTRHRLFQTFRPKANRLPSYTPSRIFTRMAEAA